MTTSIPPKPPAASRDAPRRGSAAHVDGGAPTRWQRGRVRRLRLLARVTLVGVIAAATVFEVNVATDPRVTGAPAAVVAIDRVHSTAPEMIGASEHIAEALVASEDATFYANHGVDVVAMLRAFWGYMTGQDLGGSTIEIQLAHMLYPSVTEGFWGRVRRVSLALQFDTHYTKTAILSMYLSAAYFGHGYYGIRAASRGYFGVAPSALDWAQAALLAGILQAPSALDPLRHLSAAKARMAYVLQRLVNDGQLTAAEANHVQQGPLGLANAAPAMP